MALQKKRLFGGDQGRKGCNRSWYCPALISAHLDHVIIIKGTHHHWSPFIVIDHHLFGWIANPSFRSLGTGQPVPNTKCKSSQIPNAKSQIPDAKSQIPKKIPNTFVGWMANPSFRSLGGRVTGQSDFPRSPLYSPSVQTMYGKLLMAKAVKIAIYVVAKNC